MCARLMLTLLVGCGSLIELLPCAATDIFLTSTDPLNTTSFNVAGNWSNGMAPSPANDYFTGNFVLRTPNDGGSYTFEGASLTVNNTNNFQSGGFWYKGTGTGGTITVNNLILDGGIITHQNGTGDLLRLAGNLHVESNSQLFARQGTIDVSAIISGSATITNPGSDGPGRVLVFSSPNNTFTGSLVNNGRFELADNGVLNFVIGASGINNSISGNDAATALNGDFKFDLNGAGNTLGDSWSIVTASNVSYGSSFSISGFTPLGSTWRNGIYQFSELTGILSVAPLAGDVNVDGEVDEIDYGVILSNFRMAVSSRSEGDLNGDGIVDLADFAEWRLSRDEFLALKNVRVPEPGTLCCVLSCLLAMTIGRSNRQSHSAAPKRHPGPDHRGIALVLGTALVVVSSVQAVNCHAQLSNPIPAPITKQGLRVEIEDVVQFPASLSTLGGKPDHIPSSHARINFFREAPDGRLFVNDLRGQLYRLDENFQPQLYLDIDANNGGAGSIFPATWFTNGLASGFISFTFHPEFQSNGLFYTIHMERAINTSAVPHFSTTDLGNPNQGVVWHTVINEWEAADPAANTWNEATGSRREVLRVGTTATAYFHPYGDLQFNPTSRPGDDDYGLLYISGGDWGYINGAGAPQDPDTEGQPGQLQRLDSLASTLIRIDPRSPSVTGGQPGLGDYTIPAGNPFVDGNPNTLDEIYAFGFRNGHRMAWDIEGTLLVNNVGHANLEEVERIVPGGNYGWSFREGTFINGNDLANGGNGDADDVFAHNVPDAQDVDFRGEPYLYPMVQYDHGEGSSIAGGFVYQGTQIPQLYGKYIFGDIVNGRIFAADIQTMLNIDITNPGPTAPVQEIQLFTRDEFGVEDDVDLRGDIFGGGRVDLRFGVDSAGELWVMTKQDGFLRRLVGPGPTLVLYVDPTTGQAVLKNTSESAVSLTGYSVISHSASLVSEDWQSLADHDLTGWDEAPSSAAALSELNPYHELTLSPGDRYNLGRIFDFGSGEPDLALEFLLAGAQDFQSGVVLYRLAADFNFDQQVDEQDLALWHESYGLNGGGDADGDGDTDGRDFLVWQRQAGQSSLLLVPVHAVPEPGALVLGTMLYLGMCCNTRMAIV